jgi:hypothetical protein
VTLLAPHPRSIKFGRPITLTVAIKVPRHSREIPTGTVTFIYDLTPLGIVFLRRGRAIFRVAEILPVGLDLVQVVYSGDGVFETSSSWISLEIVSAGHPRHRRR